MSKRTFDNLFLVQEFILVAEYLPSMYEALGLVLSTKAKKFVMSETS